MKVLNEVYERGAVRLELEAIAGSHVNLGLRLNNPSIQLRVTGGEVIGNQLLVNFPRGDGYVTQKVSLDW
jgi:hypothetical protein